ncbi:MAG: tetratricopeptide repeat protein [Planctomycetota bacterium]|jgi:TolA-binding protein
MSKKILFVPLVLCVLLLSKMPEECFADASAQLEQAEAYQKQRQYEQAKEIYQQLVTDYPRADYAFQAQKGLTILYVTWDKQPQAEAAFQQLLTSFPGHRGIAQAVHDIAYQHRLSRKNEKANLLDQHVIDNWPKSDYAVLAQMDLAKCYVDRDNPAAKAAVDKLLVDFADNPLIARAVHDVAQHYRRAGKYQKANELYQYVINHCPKTEHAMWSQVDLIKSNLVLDRDGVAQVAVDKLLVDFADNPLIAQAVHDIAYQHRLSRKYEKANQLDQHVIDNFPQSDYAVLAQMDIAKHYVDRDNAAAKAAVEKLLAVFPDSPFMARAVHDVAQHYSLSGKYQKANELYQHVIDHWPKAEHAILSQIGIAETNVLSLIESGNDTAIEAALDSLIADYDDNPGLPETVFIIGEKHYNKAFRYEKEGLDAKARDSFTKAIAVWGKIITKLPKSIATAWAYNCSADCYCRLGQHKKAIEYYQKVVDDWPDYEYVSDVLFRIGRNYETLMKSGLMSKVKATTKIRAVYEQLLEKYPDCKAAKHASRWLSQHNYK